MRKQRLSLLLILLALAIGFAAVTTNLILNGNTKIGIGEFDVFFSQAYAENEDDRISISDDKHSLNFNTRVLSMASYDGSDVSVFNYQISNNSADYDADVELRLNISSSINYAEYIQTVLLYYDTGSVMEITDGMTVTIPAKSTLDGIIQIKLLKPVTEDATFDFSVNLTALPTTRLSAATPGMTDVYAYSNLDAGLYDTNMNMIKSWDDLKDEETIYVSNEGELYSNFNEQYFFYTQPTGGYGGSNCGGRSLSDDCESPKMGKITSMLQAKLGAGSNSYIIDYDEMLEANTSCANLNGVLVVDTEVEKTRDLNFTCPGLKAVIFKNYDQDTAKQNEMGFAGIKVFNGLNSSYTVTGYETGHYFSAGNAKIDGDWAYDANDPTRVVAYLGNDSNIVIPDGTVEISGPAFAYLKYNSITFPESLTQIGDGVFCHIDRDTVSIPGTVREIGSKVVSDSYVKNVILGDGIRTIGVQAFDNQRIKSITVPDSVTFIGSKAFKDIDYLYYHGPAEVEQDYYGYWGATYLNPYLSGDFVFYDEELTILEGYDGEGGDVVIPNGVVEMSDIFRYVPLTSLTLPNTLKEIHGWGFFGSNLHYLEIPSSVDTIDTNALEGILIIKYHGSATFNDDNKNWGATYLNCDDINGFVITEDGKDLYRYYRPYTDNIIRDLEIPAGVEKIYSRAISNNKYIENVYLPDSIKILEDNAISGTSANEIIVPNTIESVGYKAFGGVINIKYNGSLPTDDWGAYYINAYIDNSFVYENNTKKKVLGSIYSNDAGTTNLDLIIPEGVEEIGTNAFSSSNYGDHKFHITSLSLPSSLRIIGSNAFYNSQVEGDIIIPANVELIDSGAFAHHNSHYIYIPASVTKIGRVALYKPATTSGNNTGEVVFEEHAKWSLYRFGLATIYHQGDYFNDTQAVYNELVHYNSDYEWTKVS